jgi:hypothetical protein
MNNVSLWRIDPTGDGPPKRLDTYRSLTDATESAERRGTGGYRATNSVGGLLANFSVRDGRIHFAERSAPRPMSGAEPARPSP